MERVRERKREREENSKSRRSQKEGRAKETGRRERGKEGKAGGTRRAHKSGADIGATLASDSSIDRYLNEYSSAVRDPLFEIKAEGTTVHLDVRRYPAPAGPAGYRISLVTSFERGRLSSRDRHDSLARGYRREKEKEREREESRVSLERPRLSGTRTRTCTLSASVIRFRNDAIVRYPLPSVSPASVRQGSRAC